MHGAGIWGIPGTRILWIQGLCLRYANEVLYIQKESSFPDVEEKCQVALFITDSWLATAGRRAPGLWKGTSCVLIAKQCGHISTCSQGRNQTQELLTRSMPWRGFGSVFLNSSDPSPITEVTHCFKKCAAFFKNAFYTSYLQQWPATLLWEEGHTDNICLIHGI